MMEDLALMMSEMLELVGDFKAYIPSLGIQSPPEHGNGTLKYYAEEVIEHPSHSLII